MYGSADGSVNRACEIHKPLCHPISFLFVSVTFPSSPRRAGGGSASAAAWPALLLAAPPCWSCGWSQPGQSRWGCGAILARQTPCTVAVAGVSPVLAGGCVGARPSSPLPLFQQPQIEGVVADLSRYCRLFSRFLGPGPGREEILGGRGCVCVCVWGVVLFLVMRFRYALVVFLYILFYSFGCCSICSRDLTMQRAQGRPQANSGRRRGMCSAELNACLAV
jgi:hypothetical protein